MGGGTSDGRNQANQLINIVYPINKILSIPSGAGFLPSTVWIPYILLFLWITERLKEGPPTWSPFPLPSTMVFFFLRFCSGTGTAATKMKGPSERSQRWKEHLWGQGEPPFKVHLWGTPPLDPGSNIRNHPPNMAKLGNFSVGFCATNF